MEFREHEGQMNYHIDAKIAKGLIQRANQNESPNSEKGGV